MRGLVFLLGLVDCSVAPADPELQARRRALDAWERGVAALDSGDAVRAAEAFGQARRDLASSAVIAAWQARAAASGGDLEGALVLLDEAAALDPDLSVVLYDRAAYLARGGRPDEAGRALQAAMDADPALTARVMPLDDPDFAPWLDHPAFVFLQRNPMSILVRGPRGSVFVDGEVRVTLQVLGARGERVSVLPERATGPLEWVRTDENVRRSTDGLVLDLTWTFRALGAGRAELGPFVVRSGPHEARAEAVEVQIRAPGDVASVEPVDVRTSFRTPRELRLTEQVPDAVVAGNELRVVTEPATQVDVQFGERRAIPTGTFRFQRDFHTEWVVHTYEAAGPAEVTVRRGDQVLLDGPPRG